MEETRIRKKKWHSNYKQDISQKFFEMVKKNCENERCLGELPLHVKWYTSKIKIQADNLMCARRKCRTFLAEDLRELFDDLSSDAIDEYVMVSRFLDGRLEVRPKVWLRNNGREIHLLANKPERTVITVKLSKGETLALEDRNGHPYAITI